MNSKVSSQSHDQVALSEKYRKALEKMYGFEIPLPKCIARNGKQQKNTNWF